MSIEPRFGKGSFGSESLGQALLRAQSHTDRTLGRVEASIDSLKEQGSRQEKAMENMGKRLERKIDDTFRDVSGALSGREDRCRDHDARLAALEHDKSRLLGARWAVRLLWALLSTLGLGGVAALVSWWSRMLAQG